MNYKQKDESVRTRLFYAGLIFTKKYFQVSIYISDSGNTKVFDQDIDNIWRQEGW